MKHKITQNSTTVAPVFFKVPISELQEVVMELIASNGCSAEDRVTLSGIADQFADFLLANKEKLKKKKQLKKKPRRSKRAPYFCEYVCTPSCRQVCTKSCDYECVFDPCYYEEYYEYDLCNYWLVWWRAVVRGWTTMVLVWWVLDIERGNFRGTRSKVSSRIGRLNTLKWEYDVLRLNLFQVLDFVRHFQITHKIWNILMVIKMYYLWLEW